MYNGYSELNKLPPDAFLQWENFRTEYDCPGDAYSLEQYSNGLEIGRASVTVGISMNGTWYALGKDRSTTTSYEGIGYHRSTADLLHGLLDSGCPFVVHRFDYPSKQINRK